MDKKNYIILGIVLCIVLAASGCAQNNTGNNSTPTIGPQNNSTPNSSSNVNGSSAIITIITYSNSFNGFANTK